MYWCALYDFSGTVIDSMGEMEPEEEQQLNSEQQHEGPPNVENVDKSPCMDVIYTGIGQITKLDLQIAKESGASIFIYDVPNPHKEILLFAQDHKIPIVRFRNIVDLVRILRGSGTGTGTGSIHDDVADINIDIDRNV